MSATDPSEAEASTSDLPFKFYVETQVLLDNKKFAGFAQSQGLPPAHEVKTKSEEEQQLLCMQGVHLLSNVLQLSDVPVLHLRGGGAYSDDDDFTVDCEEDDDNSDDEDCCLSARKHLKNITNRKTKPTSEKGEKKRRQDRKKAGHEATAAKEKKRKRKNGSLHCAKQYTEEELMTLPFSVVLDGKKDLQVGQRWPTTKYKRKTKSTFLCDLCVNCDDRRNAERTIRRDDGDIRVCHCCLPKRTRSEVNERQRDQPRSTCSASKCEKYRRGGTKYCLSHLYEFDFDEWCDVCSTANDRFRERYQNDYCFRAMVLSRSRLYKAMKGLKNDGEHSKTALSMVGLSSSEKVDDLLLKLAEMRDFKLSQWSTSVDYEEQIQLDHEAPFAVVLTKEFWTDIMGYPEDKVPDFLRRIEIANHWTNFQFLTARENKAKGDTWTDSVTWSEKENRWVRTDPKREKMFRKIHDAISSSSGASKKDDSSIANLDFFFAVMSNGSKRMRSKVGTIVVEARLCVFGNLVLSARILYFLH